LARFLTAKLPALASDWWQKRVIVHLSFQQQRLAAEHNYQTLQQLDFGSLLRVLDQNWFDLSTTFGLPREGRNWVKELQTVRNRWAHLSSEPVPATDAYRDADTLGRLLEALKADDASLRIVADVKFAALHEIKGRNEVIPGEKTVKADQKSVDRAAAPESLTSQTNEAGFATASPTPPAVGAEFASPRRFRDGSGPEWGAYAEALKLLDAVWRGRRFGHTSIRVFGPKPSWEDTIARGDDLFELESWAQLDEDQKSMIAPTHFFAGGEALLGSIGRRSKDVCWFLLAPEAAGARDHALSLLKEVRGLPARSIPVRGGDYLTEMCAVRGMGRSFATRLLTLARPDEFVVVNNKSVGWLREATGLSLSAGSDPGRSYRRLLEWVGGQAWHNAAEPSEPLERRLWRNRAALLDAFAYQPWE
jgi:hypothetical protein